MMKLYKFNSDTRKHIIFGNLNENSISTFSGVCIFDERDEVGKYSNGYVSFTILRDTFTINIDNNVYKLYNNRYLLITSGSGEKHFIDLVNKKILDKIDPSELILSKVKKIVLRNN
jgi:hypothetical protein